jgi:spore coat polysaccharide biosynthesis protein SpsF
MMRIVGIIQARLDSNRLPGKALKTTQDGRALLGYVIERAKHVQGLNSIVIATTGRDIDTPLCTYAAQQGIDYFRGSLDNVAQRMLNCALTWKSDYFIRLNGDSPFLDTQLLDQGIDACIDGKVDLVTNLIGRTFPYGISVEIIRTDTFQRIYSNLISLEYQEHITQYFYHNIDQFTIHRLTSSNLSLSKARLVVDTMEDWETFEQMVHHLGEKVFVANYEEVARLYLRLKDKNDRKVTA